MEVADMDRQDVKYGTMLVGLNAVDAVQTLWIIHLGGSEANPVMAAVLEYGPAWFVAFKVVAIVIVVLLAVRLAPWALRVGCIVSGAVVVWNAGVMLVLHGG
jgi:TctA family transporter